MWESALTGYQAVGEDGYDALSGGIYDSASSDAHGVAAKAHAHGQSLLAAGLGPLKGVIQDEGTRGGSRSLQQGNRGKKMAMGAA